MSPDAAIVINEVYGGGGNSGATLTHDFVELYNASEAPVSIDGWSVQYASSTGSTWNGRTNLSGTIAPGSYYLIQQATNNATVGAPLPTPDLSGTTNLSGSTGKVALVSSTTALTGATGNAAGAPSVVDFVGWGSAGDFAGAGAAPATTSATSVSRDAVNTNTANNAVDFTAGTPTPTASSAGEPEEPPVDPEAPLIYHPDKPDGFSDIKSFLACQRL